MPNTRSDDERVVRESCKADYCGTSWTPVRVFVGSSGHAHSFKNWLDARAFTDERRKQIAEVEEEIDWLAGIPRDAVKDFLIANRLLFVRRAALSELKRGMKGD